MAYKKYYRKENWLDLQEELADDDIHADFYESKNPFVSYIHNKRLDKICELLGNLNGRLLDLGCGDGYLLKRLGKFNAFGLDISLKRLKRVNKDNLVQGDATKLPFKNNSFDVVVCSEVLEHVPDPKLLIKEIKRVIKKSGNIIISVPNEFNWRLARLLTLRFPIKIPDHINKFSIKQLDLMFGKKHDSLVVLPKMPKFLGLNYILKYSSL